MSVGAVLKLRRATAAVWGPLAQTYTAAMRIWDGMKADGVSLEERQAVLERTLRASWPQVRAWHYLCETCGDTGWEYLICTPERPCGRPFHAQTSTRLDDYTGRGRCESGHRFVRACWCKKGREVGVWAERSSAPAEDFTAAGKTTKPQKLGRW